MRPTFSIFTLGCKVNQYESEKIVQDFLEKGFSLPSSPAQTDICVINTCTVTQEADAKSRKLIRKVSKINPSVLVVVTGCYANRNTQEILAIPGVETIVSNTDKTRLAELVEKRLGSRYKLRAEDGASGQKFHTRALVKIQDGCDQFCSYCIVPYVRGRPKSRGEKEILGEISHLVEGGVKEIVLTGVNLGKYGVDLFPGNTLTNLLRKIFKISELKRVRLSSINVEDLSPELLHFLSTSPKFCPHLHIPLQSGGNLVLKAMNRNYTREEFLATIEKIKGTIPQVALTTDVMVGFPGETEEQFEETCDLLGKVGFRKIHLFKFSSRPGTLASSLPGKISPQIKEKRAQKLVEIGENLEKEFLKRFVGEKLEVVVEKEKEGKLVGVSRNYLRVYFEGSRKLGGKLVEVLATEVNRNSLYGKLVRETEISEL